MGIKGRTIGYIYNVFLENALAIIALLVSLAALYFSWQGFLYKSKGEKVSKVNVVIPNDSEKKVPKDILFYVNVDASFESARSVLGNPLRIFTRSYSLFTNDSFETQALLYSFANCDIIIESDNEKSINMVAVQTNIAECDIIIPPLGIVLGKSQIGELSEMCGFEKAQYFRSSKDAYFAMEGYFGILGHYKYYTFGCYCYDASEFRDGKLFDLNGNEMKVEKMLIDFIAISNNENRGHNIDYRSFR